MDRLMAFLQKYIGGFFDWWEDFTGLPTLTYSGDFNDITINWSIVAFFLAVIMFMMIALPGGIIYG